MNTLAGRFVGTHDFAAFRWRCSAPDTVKTLVRVDVVATDSGYVFDIEGNGFLRRMVRKLVGALVSVGTGDHTVDEVSALLDSGIGYGAPHGAPAEGLTLMAILRVDTG
jgi:tRNA pseudouridine38-40 synthase